MAILRRFLALAAVAALQVPVSEAQPPGGRTVIANVAAIDQLIVYNRLGSQQVSGMMYALLRDLIPTKSSGQDQTKTCAEQACTAGNVQLRPGKRPRPLVLRMNVDDILEVHFTNLLSNPNPPPSVDQTGEAYTTTREASFHPTGLELVGSILSDGSFVGANNSSIAPPGGGLIYKYRAAKPGTYLVTSAAGMLGGTGAGQTSAGLFGAVNVEPAGALWYRSQVTEADLKAVTSGTSSLGQPLIGNYDKLYAAGAVWPGMGNVKIAADTPILDILNSKNEIVHSDLTAIISGSKAGPFTDHHEPLFRANPASPDRTDPWREFTIIYHSDFNATQAFPQMISCGQVSSTCSANENTLATANQAGIDDFGINYGIGGIAAEIFANRLGVGPEGKCSECKYEEFFLSSWSVGDPAMVVDFPANGGVNRNNTNGQGTMNYIPPVSGTPNPGKNPFQFSANFKATVAYYPDDPSNVYHSYLNDHVKFQILSADSDLHHIHHQHAHQWLHTPDSDESTYLDSQAIGPGSSFTLEMTYGGSGNRNLTAGDSIFHCHFYPHFAQGMWALWRVHDVFEAGTQLEMDGVTPATGSRALPDGEINAGTPIPAIVPIPSMPMPIMPSPVQVVNGQVVFGANDKSGDKVTQNPGFPFFIPGVPGQRAPAPPLDFAITQNQPMDGGLHRRQSFTGTVTQYETPYNFTKDTHTLVAKALDEQGNHVEKVAMAYMAQGSHSSFTSSGAPGVYKTNGQGPQQGAPFADPCPLPGKNPVPSEPESTIIYKAADIQIDAILNKKGWHNPQQRMLALWGDVGPTLFGDAGGKKAPEPFFFRANSNSCIEYWHTNLVPNYYELDNFQVRTPTDILGQHIHLVKFDVLASDGATNGFNYEDGTMSPQEVQEEITAINADGGLVDPVTNQKTMLTLQSPVYFCDLTNGPLKAQDAATQALYCNTDSAKGALGLWAGAQTTIQRWWADPLLNNPVSGKQTDRTLRTVFTHDHFGPSTHQQAGLYAGLLVEPNGSSWFMPDPNDPTKTVKMDTRTIAPGINDGGPTSWQANVVAGNNGTDSFREFAMEFADLQLAYLPGSKATMGPSPGGCTVNNSGSPSCGDLSKFGWYQNPGTGPANVVNPPLLQGGGTTTPQFVSESFDLGTYSLNYRNEPLPFRAWTPAPANTPSSTAGTQSAGTAGDLSFVYASIKRGDNALNCQPDQTYSLGYGGGTSCEKKGNDKRMYPKLLQAGQDATDPYTPLLRTYQGDKVQVRLLVGSHLSTHDFSIHGMKWLAEPSYADSGFRNNQVMGISEHFELLFKVPPTKADADYLYQADGSYLGQQHGIWGLLRAYKSDVPDLAALPNNPQASRPALPASGACPAGANPVSFTVHALTADSLPGKQLTFNSRFALYNANALVYVEDSRLQGVLAGTIPLEPLVLRVGAGDCAKVTVVNDFTPGSAQFPPAQPAFGVAGPADQVYPSSVPIFNYGISLKPSQSVGLHPQLLAYDVTDSDGFNVGKNPVQTAALAPTGCKPLTGSCAPSQTYTWYAGDLFDATTGAYSPHPVEFGAANLLASDSMYQGSNGLVGAIIIEPKGFTYQPDVVSQVSGKVTDPSTGKSFREGVIITQDYTFQRFNIAPPSGSSSPTSSYFPGTTAVNYGSEPWDLRFGESLNGLGRRGWRTVDQSCGLSNRLVTFIQPEANTSGNWTQAKPASAVGELMTPIFTANAGDPTRLRVLNPGGLNELVFELYGHVWPELPYVENSTKLGNNPLSQPQGARMGHGSNNHFDILLDSAGGKSAVAGDYLYRSRPALGFRYGMWGAFRVAEPGKDAVSITANDTNTQKTIIGFNTVNPATGKLAASVQLYVNGVAGGSGCSGATAPVVIPVNQTTGGWVSALLPTGTNTVCVQSALGGVDSLSFVSGSFRNACTSNPGSPNTLSTVNPSMTISSISARKLQVVSELQELDKSTKQSRIAPQPVTTPVPTATNPRPAAATGAKSDAAIETSRRAKILADLEAARTKLTLQAEKAENPTPAKPAAKPAATKAAGGTN